MHPDQYQSYTAQELTEAPMTATEELANEIERAEVITKEMEQRLMNALSSPHPIESQSDSPPQPQSPLRALAGRLSTNNDRVAHLLNRLDL